MQSYPKVHKSSSERTGKPRKRRFHGNQFHNVSSADDEEANTSRSEKKLASTTTDDVIIYPSHCYRIIEWKLRPASFPPHDTCTLEAPW
ncbi:hypothetical protein EVAR_52202_1 [Eumeta japonica]|uniref:Uncharacterized protein n=1 Tax=Eumeta variegata TaxID=151549 RepID=A0A4C1Z2R3_EUMVA|nr:hypothetical protein EVAR_52202_1 [Eumeta japonica]